MKHVSHILARRCIIQQPAGEYQVVLSVAVSLWLRTVYDFKDYFSDVVDLRATSVIVGEISTPTTELAPQPMHALGGDHYHRRGRGLERHGCKVL